MKSTTDDDVGSVTEISDGTFDITLPEDVTRQLRKCYCVINSEMECLTNMLVHKFACALESKGRSLGTEAERAQALREFLLSEMNELNDPSEDDSPPTRWADTITRGVSIQGYSPITDYVTYLLFETTCARLTKLALSRLSPRKP